MAGSSYGGEVGVTSEVHWRNEFGRFARDIDLAGTRAVTAASIRGAYLAAVFAPKKTLRLAGSIEPYSAGAGQGGFVANMPYAMPQEVGARPHEIGHEGQKLVNRAERFYAIGPVLHPGNPATHFMRRAAAEAQRILMREIKRGIPG